MKKTSGITIALCALCMAATLPYGAYVSASAYVDTVSAYLVACRSAGAHVALLSSEQADWDTVYYLQARFLTVWVNTVGFGETQIAGAIGSGCYGLVTDDASLVNQTLGYYSKNSQPRGFYNVGHRGLPSVQNENSIEGCAEAFRSGATHLEIDIRKTKDDHLVIMHDATIDRTTNGTGSVSEMTLDELRQFKITKNYKGGTTGTQSVIPTLDEMFEEFRAKDVILVVEIKGDEPQIVPLLKECVERYEMQKQTIVISFYSFGAWGNQFERLHKLMPQMPIAVLNTVTASNFDGCISRAAEYNCCFDQPQNADDGILKNLKDRGYALRQWTYDASSLNRAVLAGVTGITNNDCDLFGDDFGKKLYVDHVPSIGRNESILGKSVSAKLITYAGEIKDLSADVFLFEKCEDGWNVVLCYEYGGHILYTPMLHLPFANGGCNSVSMRGMCSAVALFTAAALFALPMIKRRKLHE